MARKPQHGEAIVGKVTKEYGAWAGIKKRCNNPNHKHYKNYGGRGISVCQRWSDSFQLFLYDMGRAPSKQHSLERIDTNGNYEPDNCRWATRIEQANNKRTNIKVTVNGLQISLKQACKDMNLNYRRTHQRIHLLNWPIEKALMEPRQKYKDSQPNKKMSNL